MQRGIRRLQLVVWFRQAGLRQIAGRAAALAALVVLLGVMPAVGQARIEIQNLAGVSKASLKEMAATGRRAFGLAEIATRWAAENGVQTPEAPASGEALPLTAAGYRVEDVGGRRIQLRLVTSRHAFSTNPACLGEALVVDGGGSLAIIYVDRVRAFAARHRLPLGRVLAYAAAHEVGHLLLGDSSHTASGLMRAFWDRDDAEAMRAGTLMPGEATAARMQRSIPDRNGFYAARLAGK